LEKRDHHQLSQRRRKAQLFCRSYSRAREATVESLEMLSLPDMASTVTPLVYAIPIQLIAYHTAAAIGTDVDQPRNLAKSVTVE
jgi:glucosamine 6-phosphate synthetase-like amidotransferase/phosphosugar isomerase protein